MEDVQFNGSKCLTRHCHKTLQKRHLSLLRIYPIATYGCCSLHLQKSVINGISVVNFYFTNPCFFVVFNTVAFVTQKALSNSALPAIICIENWWILQYFQESWALRPSIVNFNREAVDFKAPHFADAPQPSTLSTVEGFLAAMAAMPRQLKVTTLEGGVLTVQVVPTTTIKELRAMLHEKKHCEDPIERKILKVKVLADGLLVDDDQTLESAGLLHPEAEVTVIYSRNEVEAATKEAIHAEGFLQVNIPFSLTEISDSAFEDDHQVVKVAIPESVTAIGDGAFAGCEYLASITIPDSVTAIGNYAFADCKSLESITIPESVTAIGDSAFIECKSLKSITILASVATIGRRAFEDCKSLTSITLPESVSLIRERTFKNCSSLTSITLPESVSGIGEDAFQNCSSLASIRMPESVVIRYRAFEGCKSESHAILWGMMLSVPLTIRCKLWCSIFDGCLFVASIGT